MRIVIVTGFPQAHSAAGVQVESSFKQDLDERWGGGGNEVLRQYNEVIILIIEYWI